MALVSHSRSSRKSDGYYRGPRTLSVLPTYTCTACCRDCGTLSGPRERTNLSLDSILSAIDQAAQYDFANVVFTGGEPTLRWSDLLTSIVHATSLGLPTRIVTNAYWAVSRRRADGYLQALQKAGLTEINFSTGDEHARFVPVERVVNAIVAALELEMRVDVMIELRAERRVTQQVLAEHPRILALDPETTEKLSFSESPWMPLDPFAAEKYPVGTTCNRDNVGIMKGCDSILQAYAVGADGRIGCCCGLGSRLIPEMYVGCVDQRPDFLWRAVEEAENDFLKVWLRYKGPEKIVAWAAAKDSNVDWENRYSHRCQACLRVYLDPRIREIVRLNYREMYGDVLQSVYLDEEYTPDTLGSAFIGAGLERRGKGRWM
jgi:organic radical activating enzyme